MTRGALVLLMASACWRSSTPPPEQPLATTPDAQAMVMVEVGADAESEPVDAGIKTIVITVAPPPCRSSMKTRLVAANVASGGVEVTLAAGTDRGVTPAWRVVVPKDCTVLSVEPRVTRALCNTTLDQLRAGPQEVLLCSP